MLTYAIFLLKPFHWTHPIDFTFITRNVFPELMRELRLFRGSHPFDYGDTKDMRDDDTVPTVKDGKDSGDLMGFSQRSYIQDELTKQRILDGTVYFCESVWASLRNGTCTACALVSLRDNRQPLYL